GPPLAHWPPTSSTERMPRKTTVIEPAIPAIPMRKPTTASHRAGVRAGVVIIGVPASRTGSRQAIQDHPFDLVHADPLLGHRVAIADGDRPVLQRIDIDGDAPWRADLVLAAVQLADRCRVIVDGHQVTLQVVLD